MLKIIENIPSEDVIRIAERLHSVKLNGVSHKDLTDTTFNILESNLIAYGNILSEEHRVALYELVSRYTLMAQSELDGRVVYGIDTGMGKTESLVALAVAISRLKFDHISILICQSKVEGLCELKRKMMCMGVPESEIGLIHSYNFDEKKLDVNGRVIEEGFASLPATPINEQRQFQLVTHARIRNGYDFSKCNTYKDAPRTFAIWDESLLISDTESINAKDIRKAVHNFSVDFEDTNNYKSVVDYFKHVLLIIENELQSQKSGSQPDQLNLPTIDSETRKIYSILIDRIKGSELYKATLKSLLEISLCDLRLLRTSQGDTLVSYSISIPKELNKVIILDASWWIRDLQKIDSTIRDVSKFVKSIKKYDDVTVHQMLSAGGRSAMTNDFKRKLTERKYTKEIATLIKKLPEVEGVLIFTYKARQNEVDFIKTLKADLIHYGINIEQSVKVKTQDEFLYMPRFNFLTWGSETSLNEYSYCSNVILAGILHRSYLDLGSSIIGQYDDLTLDLTHEALEKVHESELAHLAFQALSRGSCRTIKNGYALPMNAWIIHADIGIKVSMEQVMSGVKWKLWGESETENKGAISEVATQLLVYLDNQSMDREKISTSRIKGEAKLSKVPPTTWTKALNLAMSRTNKWKLDSRSLVRVGDFELLFPDENNL